MSKILENSFNIEEDSTESDIVPVKTTLIQPEQYDSKDNEIEEHLQSIADAADKYLQIIDNSIDLVEPKSIPRMMEVASQLMNTKLNVIGERANIKLQKDKMVVKRDSKTVNNTIMLTHHALTELLTNNQHVIDTIEVSPKTKNK